MWGINVRLYFYGQKVPEDIIKATNASVKFRSFLTLVIKRKSSFIELYRHLFIGPISGVGSTYVQMIPVIGRSLISIKVHENTATIDFNRYYLRVFDKKWLLFNNKTIKHHDENITLKFSDSAPVFTYTGQGDMFTEDDIKKH